MIYYLPGRDSLGVGLRGLPLRANMQVCFFFLFFFLERELWCVDEG